MKHYYPSKTIPKQTVKHDFTNYPSHRVFNSLHFILKKQTFSVSKYSHCKTLKSIYSVKSNVNGFILIQMMFLMSYAWAHNQMKIKFKWNLWTHNSQTQILHIDITYVEGSYLYVFYLLIQRKVFCQKAFFLNWVFVQNEQVVI